MGMGKDYSLVFKEKIQNIVDNITLDPVKRIMKNDIVQFGVVVRFNSRPINFPVKFYSVYRNYAEQTLCKIEGCVLNVNAIDVMNRNYDIHLMSGIDTKTLKKYFTYDLEPRMFKRLELLKITFKKELDPVSPNTIDRDVQRELSRKDKAFQRMEKEVRGQAQIRLGRPDIDLTPMRRNGGNWNIRIFGRF
jgi:hypothetical protein